MSSKYKFAYKLYTKKRDTVLEENMCISNQLLHLFMNYYKR